MNEYRPKDMVFRVGVGEVHAMIAAEGVAWTPDVAKDMVNRLDELWHNTIWSAVECGLIDTGLPDGVEGEEEDDDEETVGDETFLTRLFSEDEGGGEIGTIDWQ